MNAIPMPTDELSLRRLLELAGRRPLRETMTLPQARAVFQRLGIASVPADAAGLKAARNTLIRRYHEAGTAPDPDKISMVNAAYDVLKGRAQDAAPDAPAEPWRVFAYYPDGVLKYGFDTESAPSEFPTLVDQALPRLRQGFRRPAAILLLSPERGWDLLVIYANGRHLDPPLKVEMNNADNPARDPWIGQKIAQAIQGNRE